MGLERARGGGEVLELWVLQSRIGEGGSGAAWVGRGQCGQRRAAGRGWRWRLGERAGQCDSTDQKKNSAVLAGSDMLLGQCDGSRLNCLLIV